MKRIFTLIGITMGLFTSYYACKKGEANFNRQAQNEDLKLFTEAQKYFVTVLQSVPSSVPYSSGNFNPVKNLDKTLRWNSAQIENLSVGKAVVIPISFENISSGRPSWSAQQLPINSISRLVIYKDQYNNFHSIIISGFRNNALGNHSLRTFSGIAIGQDWSGSFAAGYDFPGKGAVMGLSNPFSETNTPRTKTTENQLVTTVCNYIDWYSCTAAGCTFTFTQFLGCNTAAEVEYASSSTLNNDDYAVVSSNNAPPQGSPSVVDTIYNELRTPCYQGIFTKLDTGGMKSDLANIITNTFACSDSLNYSVEEFPVLSGSYRDADAHTFSSKSGNHVTVITELNDSILAHASEEYIASTIFHEAIHGYLTEESTVQGNLNQHYAMIDSWVDVMLAGLQELFPGLTTHDGLCIILGGLNSENEFNSGTFSQVLANYNLTLSDVESTALAYRSGTSGTNCSGGGEQ